MVAHSAAGSVEGGGAAALLLQRTSSADVACAQAQGATAAQQAQAGDVNLPACTSAFDALWFCYSPASQMKKYYREGTYDDCEAHRCYQTIPLSLAPRVPPCVLKQTRGCPVQCPVKRCGRSDVPTACVDSRLFELCMRLRYREVNGKGSDASSQVSSSSFQFMLASRRSRSGRHAHG
jgi:hypothetical protein